MTGHDTRCVCGHSFDEHKTPGAECVHSSEPSVACGCVTFRVVDGAGHDNTREPSEEQEVGSDCGQSRVSKATHGFQTGYFATETQHQELLSMNALLRENERLKDCIRDMLDVSTGWSRNFADAEALIAITNLGNAALKTGDRSTVVSEQDWKNSRG